VTVPFFPRCPEAAFRPVIGKRRHASTYAAVAVALRRAPRLVRTAPQRRTAPQTAPRTLSHEKSVGAFLVCCWLHAYRVGHHQKRGRAVVTGFGRCSGCIVRRGKTRSLPCEEWLVEQWPDEHQWMPCAPWALLRVPRRSSFFVQPSPCDARSSSSLGLDGSDRPQARQHRHTAVAARPLVRARPVTALAKSGFTV
jgi:hypothetical protein